MRSYTTVQLENGFPRCGESPSCFRLEASPSLLTPSTPHLRFPRLPRCVPGTELGNGLPTAILSASANELSHRVLIREKRRSRPCLASGQNTPSHPSELRRVLAQCGRDRR